MLAHHFQVKGLQRNGGAVLRIVGFVDKANRRFADLTQNLEAADLVRYGRCFSPQFGVNELCP